jgi:hypothetical protein
MRKTATGMTTAMATRPNPTRRVFPGRPEASRNQSRRRMPVTPIATMDAMLWSWRIPGARNQM